MTQEREKEFGEKPLLEKMFAGEDCNALMSALWELAGGRDEIYVWLNGTPKTSLVAEKSRKPKNESPSKTINPVTARANGNKKTSTIKTKKSVAKGKK